jgi:RNA polymerase sigma-70 factor (ECF subfamily)
MSDNAGITAASRSGSFGSTSASLLAGIKSQQPEAWLRLVDVYSPLVYGWCRRTGVAPGDAPDIVQDVFASVAVSINDFRGDSPQGGFRAWLSSITRRRISDHFRSKLNQPAAEGGTEARARLLSVPEPTLPPDAEELADESALVWQSVVELVRGEFEASTWQAFWRVAVDAVRPTDAAKELGMSITAVYKAKSRVLCRLRQALADLEQEGIV